MEPAQPQKLIKCQMPTYEDSSTPDRQILTRSPLVQEDGKQDQYFSTATKKLRTISHAYKLIGIAFVLLGFFGTISCFLPENFLWIPWLCCFLSLVAYVRELMGIVLVLVGFFTFAATVLPGKLALIPGLCCMFSLLAVVQAFFPKRRVQVAADAAPEI